MGTALRRHSAVTDLQRKGEGLGVPGMRCDGMDVIDTHAVIAEAVERVRAERRPLLVEAITYRFRGHSMADPEQYRTKEEVELWRERDPLATFGHMLVDDGVLDADALARIDAEAMARVDAAVQFADSSPFPAPESLYDDVYVLGGQVRAWYSAASAALAQEGPQLRAEVSEIEAHAQPDDGEVAQQLTEALAAGEDSGEPPGGLGA
jgi:TPP-dependent pyruvate/acetoin dehydrogenase alpha subunit